MNYADIKKYDVANWDGVNISIYFSGCTLKCLGCFNKAAQSFHYGREFTKQVEDMFIDMCKDEHIDGVCLLGGEIFQQDLDRIYSVVNRIKDEVNKPIHIWSGYTFEYLMENQKARVILELVDTLVDGPFVRDLKDLTLKYRGSSNQRVIDVKKSLYSHRVILWDDSHA